MAASVFYNLGLVVQAEAARREPVGAGLAPGLLGRLVQRRRWLAGTALAAGGWPLQAFALTRAPLTVVQPALAVGLVVPLAVGAARLGEPARRRDVAGVVAVALGVSLVVAAAPPRTAETTSPLRLSLTLGIVVVAVVFSLAATRRRSGRGTALVVAAGLAYAFASLTTKLLADAFGRRAWAQLAGWGAVTAAAGATGTLAEMGALQVRAAGGVASTVFALETVVPVALSPLLFGESWSSSPGGLAIRAVGLALTLAGAIELSRAAPVVQALSEAT